VMQNLFRTAPLDPAQWALATLAGAVIVPIVATEKRIRRRRSLRDSAAGPARQPSPESGPAR